MRRWKMISFSRQTAHEVFLSSSHPTYGICFISRPKNCLFSDMPHSNQSMRPNVSCLFTYYHSITHIPWLRLSGAQFLFSTAGSELLHLHIEAQMSQVKYPMMSIIKLHGGTKLKYCSLFIFELFEGLIWYSLLWKNLEWKRNNQSLAFGTSKVAFSRSFTKVQ